MNATRVKSPSFKIDPLEIPLRKYTVNHEELKTKEKAQRLEDTRLMKEILIESEFGFVPPWLFVENERPA